MAPASGLPPTSGDGFEGAIKGVELPDVIQFNVQNRFTGCLAIQNGDLRGLVFFREGSIIHAEHDHGRGETAFYDILDWPTGRFGLQPDLAAPAVTIQKTWQHLLLEARTLHDERRKVQLTQPLPPAATAGAVKPPSRTSEVVDRVKAIPGVTRMVLMTKDGNRLGDTSFEGEVLSGQAAFLSMLATQLAGELGSGELNSALVHGTREHLILFASKNHYLCIAVEGGQQPGAVEAEIRRALSWNR